MIVQPETKKVILIIRGISKVPLGDFREGENSLGDFSLGTFAFEYAHLKLMGSVKPQSYIKVTSKPKKTIVEPGSFENFNL